MESNLSIRSNMSRNVLKSKYNSELSVTHKKSRPEDYIDNFGHPLGEDPQYVENLVRFAYLEKNNSSTKSKPF